MGHGTFSSQMSHNIYKIIQTSHNIKEKTIWSKQNKNITLHELRINFWILIHKHLKEMNCFFSGCGSFWCYPSDSCLRWRFNRQVFLRDNCFHCPLADLWHGFVHMIPVPHEAAPEVSKGKVNINQKTNVPIGIDCDLLNTFHLISHATLFWWWLERRSKKNYSVLQSATMY